MDIFYIIDAEGKNDCPADRQPGAAPTKVLAGAGKAVVAPGQYAYSGTLIVSSLSQLVVSTEFPLSSAWGSVMTWGAAAATSSGAPVLVEITDAPSATPTLDAAAMRKRGMMKYF